MARKILQNLEDYLPSYTWADVPRNLRTRKIWRRHRRQVRKGEKPVARLTWKDTESIEVVCLHSDGTITTAWERRPVIRECGLFGEGQTSPYRGSRRTWAIEIFRRYFVELSSRKQHIWWVNDHWQSCHGPLREWQLKKHLNGDEKYGIRGGASTRFLAIDLDLHNGDPSVFLDQLRVLLAEFHGKDGWHFQVANQNAGGIHLFRCIREDYRLEPLRANFRKRLQELDQRHPELAERAREVGMKTLGELEIFPDPQKGFRLPLCAGRTMLLDRPLPLVFSKRLKKDVQDVVGYVSWLSRPQKNYMPAEAVIQFVQERLAVPKPKKEKATRGKAGATSSSGEGMADLGKMKGQFRQKLVGFWTGSNTPPDSLNQAIVLLARVLPFYLDEQEKAIALIENYIDDLPDPSFSDRLSSGKRAEVSRVVRKTVRQVYNGNGGQADPETSTQKLQATVAAWIKRGFDPTDKSTWNQAVINLPDLPVNNFFWKAEDVIKLGLLQKVLNTNLDNVNNAMKYLLKMVKKHSGEIAINLVKKVLETFGIACGHNGKVNKVMAMLRQWNWIYIRSFERWHDRDENGDKQAGRARSYGIGSGQSEKFEEKPSAPINTTQQKNLYIVSHHLASGSSDNILETGLLPDSTVSPGFG